MTIIIILKIAGIVAGSSVITGLITWIIGKVKMKKAIASKQREIDHLETRVDFYQKNKQAYQAVIHKLMGKKKNAEIFEEKVNNSDGSDLSDLLNEL